ncbi:MAG TPA: S49 family peptidase, partial [Rhodopila sp.]|nr:S49 family peptidase [Rhodopila sp.]
FAKDLMDKLHVRFVSWVKSRRGQRLKAPDESLFDGGYMLGEQALATGLIDGFATVDDLVRQLGGERAWPRRFAPKRPRLPLRLPRMLLDAALDVLEERSWRVTLR